MTAKTDVPAGRVDPHMGEGGGGLGVDPGWPTMDHASIINRTEAALTKWRL